MSEFDKGILKQMLENSDRQDKGLPIESPLAQVDPQALDELMLRIDTKLKLRQIPATEDIEKVAAYFRAERVQIITLMSQGQTPKRKSPVTKPKSLTIEF